MIRLKPNSKTLLCQDTIPIHLPLLSLLTKELKALKSVQEGNGIVILDKDDYYKKMNEILNYLTKFALLLDDPIKTTMKHKNKLRCFLKDLRLDLLHLNDVTICHLLVHGQGFYMGYLRYISQIFLYILFYLQWELILII